MFATFGLAVANPMESQSFREQEMSQARFKREECIIFNNNNNNSKK